MAGGLTVEGGRIADLGPPSGPARPLPAGAVVLPGFVDPHLHVLAMAAARTSVDCGPGAAPTLAALAGALARAAGEGQGWLRGVGFDDALVADRRSPGRAMLDAVARGRPLVVHAATGTVAYLNTAALHALGVDAARDDGTPGVERDRSGAATGEVSKRSPLLDGVPPLPAEVFDAALGGVAADLVRSGVTAVTDATVTNGPADLDRLAAWSERSGGAPRVTAMVGAARLGEWRGRESGGAEAPSRVTVRHAKIVVEDDDPPDLASLVEAARRAGLAVALHVTDIDALDRALDALGPPEAVAPGEARPRAPGGGRPAPDRLEHVSLCLPEQVGAIAASGAAVVTQPAFMAERGAKYAEQLSAVEQAWLYRVRSFLDAGVVVAASSDAPVVAATPLASMAAAIDALVPEERVGVEMALQMVTAGGAAVSGDRGGVLRLGGPADLVVLAADPRRVAPADLAAVPVLATVVAGRVVHAAGDLGWG